MQSTKGSVTLFYIGGIALSTFLSKVQKSYAVEWIREDVPTWITCCPCFSPHLA